MRAALPVSSMPGPPASKHHRAAVDGYRLPRNEAAGIAEQPHDGADQIRGHQVTLDGLAGLDRVERAVELRAEKLAGAFRHDCARRQRVDPDRSEEHTSELQSLA